MTDTTDKKHNDAWTHNPWSTLALLLPIRNYDKLIDAAGVAADQSTAVVAAAGVVAATDSEL